jgi:hypothetical protein
VFVLRELWIARGVRLVAASTPLFACRGLEWNLILNSNDLPPPLSNPAGAVCGESQTHRRLPGRSRSA